MNRTPPESVLHELRREVNFGCPFPECGRPILSWHHFDPPWHEKNHHNPEGMIALCPEHHGLADGNNYTREQLRSWKKKPNNIENIKYNIPWLWDNFVYEIGTSFWSPDAQIKFNDTTIMQAKMSGQGEPWKLSMVLLGESGQILAKIEDNFVTAPVSLNDFNISYQGKNLEIIDKPKKNFLSLSCTTIKKSSIQEYLQKIYKYAYKDSKIKHPDGTIELEAENVEKMNILVKNLYQILSNYLTSDNELRILNLDGQTGIKHYTFNYTRAEEHFAHLKTHLTWGFCKGSEIII